MRDRHIVPTKPRPELPLQQELFAAQTPAVFEPVLLGQMQDELARYRMREAFWISVVVHLVAVVVLALSPKWTEAIARLFPVRTVQVKSAEDLLRERNLTFLALPKDRQIPPKEVPEAKHLSDKNRIAQSPRPQLDQKTLDELRAMQAMQRPGPPPAQAPGAQPQGGVPPQPSPPPEKSLLAENTHPENPFGAPMSPGAMINNAARGSRGGFGSGGGSVFNRGSGHVRMGPAEIISDTQGVDFGPYLSRVVETVRMNWYQLIPEEAMAPLRKKGKVTIEFAILPNGTVAGLRIMSPSGDIALDRAAYGGITSSNPFQPLPNEFHGSYFALRFRFFYNPDPREME